MPLSNSHRARIAQIHARNSVYLDMLMDGLTHPTTRLSSDTVYVGGKAYPQLILISRSAKLAAWADYFSVGHALEDGTIVFHGNRLVGLMYDLVDSNPPV